MTETQIAQTTPAAAKAAPKPRTRKAAAANAAPLEAVAAAATEEPKKAAPTGGPKLRWTVTETHVGGKDQHADAEGRTYRIQRQEDGTYVSSVQIGTSKAQVLSTTTFAKAYGSAVQHHKGLATATAA